MATFAVLFGTRHIDATEHQEGLMLAIAAESLVKLAAFLTVGFFVVFTVFGDFVIARRHDSLDLARQAINDALEIRERCSGARRHGPPFGKQIFKIPFDGTGKKWVRFAVWDSAGNGAFLQPVHLK